MASIITNLSLGGSGGINFVSDTSAESGLGAWKLYNDGSAVPQTGAGSLALSGLTLTTTTSSLRGTQSYIASKSAANVQGSGWAYDFTIDSNDQGRVVALTFDYLISGTFNYGLSTSDVQMYIYDKTNGTMQQFAPNYFTGPKDKWRGIFQAAINSTQYRLIFHVATTNSSAWTFTYDNVKCGPQAENGPAQGSIVTDWQPFTTTITTQSGTFPSFTQVSKYRRVGDSLDLDIFIQMTGTGTWTGPILSLPPGLSIDTSKTGASSNSTFWNAGDISPANSGFYQASFGYNSTNNLIVYLPSGNSFSTVSNASPTAFTSAGYFHLRITNLPIQGWSSGGIVMQQDTDTRVVAASYTADSAGQSFPANTTTPVQFNSKLVDTHGAVTTGSGWKYTVQIPGIYEVDWQVFSTTNSSPSASDSALQKNGSTIIRGSVNYPNGANQGRWTGAGQIQCVAGDVIQVAIVAGGTGFSAYVGSVDTFIRIKRLSGPSAIAATETVAFRASAAPPTSTFNGSFQNVIFPSLGSFGIDSHGCYNPTTGIYTVPIAGTYRVSAALGISSAYQPNYEADVAVLKNGTIFCQGRQVASATFTGLMNPCISSLIKCAAGDQLRVQQVTNVSGSFTSNEALNFFDVQRIGN